MWIVVLWWSQQYRSDENQNDTAGKSCLSYKASLPYSRPDFFYPIFCLHRKQLQRIARYSIAPDHIFVSAFNERRQTYLLKSFDKFSFETIYILLTIDTILCLVLIRWKIFQGIYKKLTSRDGIRWNFGKHISKLNYGCAKLFDPYWAKERNSTQMHTLILKSCINLRMKENDRLISIYDTKVVLLYFWN